jgi:hypothetical protein
MSRTDLFFKIALVVVLNGIACARARAEEKDEKLPPGDPATAEFAEGIYCGVGGMYELGKTPDGKPIAKGTILLQGKVRGSYEAHETTLKFVGARSIEAEGWKHRYQGLMFQTDFFEPGQPKYVLISAEPSLTSGRSHHYATALWDDERQKWVGNDAAVKASKPAKR